MTVLTLSLSAIADCRYPKVCKFQDPQGKTVVLYPDPGLVVFPDGEPYKLSNNGFEDRAKCAIGAASYTKPGKWTVYETSTGFVGEITFPGVKLTTNKCK